MQSSSRGGRAKSRGARAETWYTWGICRGFSLQQLEKLEDLEVLPVKLGGGLASRSSLGHVLPKRVHIVFCVSKC